MRRSTTPGPNKSHRILLGAKVVWNIRLKGNIFCLLVLQLSFFVLKPDRGRVLSSGIVWRQPDACAARRTNRG